MGLNIEYIKGQTPLDKVELEGLLISSITTKKELDEFEQQNIEEAIQWLMSRSFKAERIFTEEFVLDLHKRMFSQVWKWAGKFRTTQKNLGSDYWQVPVDLRMLFDDSMLWHSNQTFEPDELAIRFKHRIVSIHCFSNGNGRHSRLMADVIIEKIYGREVFSWGAGNLSDNNQGREQYLRSVKLADKEELKPLIDFARS
jgi:Fic-DOC domain mobile mystery protein B